MPHRGFHDGKNGGFSTIDGNSRNRHYPLTPQKQPPNQQNFFRTSPGKSGRRMVKGRKIMKTKSKTSGYIIRSAAYAALLSCLIVGFTSGFNLPNRWSALSRSVFPGSMTKPATHTKALTLADRVAYQRAIEEVYWRHRIWRRKTARPSRRSTR